MGNTASPSSQPSHVPTFIPTSSPSVSHTPTFKLSTLPTSLPSFKPSLQPTFYPTVSPSYSCEPTISPSDIPTHSPSYLPSTYNPTTPSPTNFIGWTHGCMMKLNSFIVLVTCGICVLIIFKAVYFFFSFPGKESHQRIPEQPEIEVDPPDIQTSDSSIELITNMQEQLELAHEQMKEMERINSNLKKALEDAQQLVVERNNQDNNLKHKLSLAQTQLAASTEKDNDVIHSALNDQVSHLKKQFIKSTRLLTNAIESRNRLDLELAYY